MGDLGHILVILDKPKHPQRALARAVDLARRSGAHLHLVSFLWVPMATDEQVFDTHQRRAIRKSAQTQRRTWLDALVRDEGLLAADVSAAVEWTDDIAGWTVDYVTENRPDLVVKSVHHSRTLLHTPLDWQLLRTCPAPLLLASTAESTGNGDVLAAVDLGFPDEAHRRMSERVLEEAQRFAAIEGTGLQVVSVMEVGGSFEDLEFFDRPRMAAKARRQAREELDTLPGGAAVTGGRLHLPDGKAGQAVAEAARSIAAGLLVVGTGAHRSLGGMLLGGSAEKILSRSPCDVLAVHG